MPFNAPTACGLPANYTPVTSPPTSPPQPYGNGSGESLNIACILVPLLPEDYLLITHLQHCTYINHYRMAMDQVRVLTLHSWPRVIKRGLNKATVSFNAPTACRLPANYTPVTSPPTSPPQPQGNGSGESFNITFMATSYQARALCL